MNHDRKHGIRGTGQGPVEDGDQHPGRCHAGRGSQDQPTQTTKQHRPFRSADQPSPHAQRQAQNSAKDSHGQRRVPLLRLLPRLEDHPQAHSIALRPSISPS